MQAIETQDVAALSTSQIAAFTTAQVSQALTTAQVVALTTAQAGALTTGQIAALTTSQVQAIETQDVAALKTSQIAALTTSQVASGLTTAQVQALTTAQVEALTTSQKAAFTTDQIPRLNLTGTPIVLDLNGNGVTTQNISNGVRFDIFGVGEQVGTGWVSGGDGLLVLDRNQDGAINGGGELFGEGTTLQNGQKAANGYLALSELDDNGDGVVSSSDAKFADLMAWVDGDSDGVSQTSELRSLTSLGITQLDLRAQTSDATDNGNLLGLVSKYTTVDGAVHDMADVWFQVDAKPQVASPGADAPRTLDFNLALPEPRQGVIAQSEVGSTKSGLQTGAADSSIAANANLIQGGAPLDDDLRSQVGGLVDALAAFDKSGMSAPDVLQKGVQLPAQNAGASLVMSPSSGSGLGGMLDAMKRFDANGNAVGMSSLAHSAAAPATLDKFEILKAQTDILVSGKPSA